MAGQAAIGVMVSLVQLVSAAISLRLRSAQSGRTPEEVSAFVCFAFATCLLCISLVAHSWLVRTPAYEILISPIEQRMRTDKLEERQALLSSSYVARATKPKQETASARIIRVARANVIYELAVACVFIVTLVCPFLVGFRKFTLIHRLHIIVRLPAHYNSHHARQPVASPTSLQRHPRPSFL
ncbi:hypothetical protein F5148DRAFT_1185877, partial [Russula earlei]